MCCKEVCGHREDECPKDPNIRNGFAVLDEDKRIEHKIDTKKNFCDTNMTTLRMMKEFSKSK